MNDNFSGLMVIIIGMVLMFASLYFLNDKHRTPPYQNINHNNYAEHQK